MKKGTAHRAISRLAPARPRWRRTARHSADGRVIDRYARSAGRAGARARRLGLGLRLGPGLELVADAPDGADGVRLVAQLLAQPLDVGVDRPIGHVVVVAPDPLQQIVAAEGPTG